MKNINISYLWFCRVSGCLTNQVLILVFPNICQYQRAPGSVGCWCLLILRKILPFHPEIFRIISYLWELQQSKFWLILLTSFVVLSLPAGRCGQSPQQQCGEPPGWSPHQTEEGRGWAGWGKDNTELKHCCVINQGLGREITWSWKKYLRNKAGNIFDVIKVWLDWYIIADDKGIIQIKKLT